MPITPNNINNGLMVHGRWMNPTGLASPNGAHQTTHRTPRGAGCDRCLTRSGGTLPIGEKGRRKIALETDAETANPRGMKTRNFLYLLAGAALPIPSCATGTSADRDPDAPLPLRVGVSGNNAPLIFETGRGRFSGVEASFATMLGAELGREVQFVSMRFDRLIPALQRGQIDIIMSGMTVTAQRLSLVDFTNPYMASGQALLVRNARANLFQDPQLIFISPFRIGVEQGTIGESVALRAHPNSTVVPFSTPVRAASALLSDRVDVVLHDAAVLWHITARNPTADHRVIPRLLTNETLAWAVRRGDSELLGRANAAIAKWRKNGMLDRTLRNHMPNSLS